MQLYEGSIVIEGHQATLFQIFQGLVHSSLIDAIRFQDVNEFLTRGWPVRVRHKDVHDGLAYSRLRQLIVPQVAFRLRTSEEIITLLHCVSKLAVRLCARNVVGTHCGAHKGMP